MERTYIAIDLKSFYASVECVSRGYDPLDVNLVVADRSRTEKTICLAVSPSLKAFGIPGRARLFEVIERVRQVNTDRAAAAPGGVLRDSSCSGSELAADPSLSVDFITAPPRMGYYMKVSSQIYGIYLRYVAPEDIHVYSIDEVFIDATSYLKIYGISARDFTMKLIHDVLSETGITATAGIGTNMYLCKIAMDIVAKHIPADADGVRIAELDETSYREKLWGHRPLGDFWRVGRGYQAKLEEYGMKTMGDVALMSVKNEDLLYRLFGVNAELLIDHAWGWEPCTIADVKSYVPESNSISSGQVLSCPYSFEKAKLVVREMTDQLALELVDKKLLTDQLILTVCFDAESLKDGYRGPVKTDMYGKKVPKDARGSISLPSLTSSSRIITDRMMALYDAIVSPGLLVRRMFVVAAGIVTEQRYREEHPYEQMDLFTDLEAAAREQEDMARERNIQEALLGIKKRYGKNAILKGMNLEEGATAMQRNRQVGGHKE